MIAIVNYYAVFRDVEPLKKKVRDMEKQQADSAKELAEINAALATLTKELAELDVRYREASAELATLKENAAIMERRLVAASKLISGLGSERDRWGADVEKLQGQQTRLVGDCLLAASFLSYLGPFTYDYRMKLLQGDWAVDIGKRGIPVTTPFSLEELLTTEATVQKWYVSRQSWNHVVRVIRAASRRNKHPSSSSRVCCPSSMVFAGWRRACLPTSTAS